MQITIQPPLAFSELGQRQNNEDSIFPLLGTANQNTNLFLVCDGVGGMEKGEIASNSACETIANYVAQNPTPNPDTDYINAAVAAVQQIFADYEQQHQAAKGMATTLTLLHIHEQGITVAHIGDSRVYQVRKGQILHKTTDHSLVNDLLKNEIITPEEAINHPQKNVIVRALQAERKVKAEVILLTDLQVGDYFLLCTDGVLEHLDETTLCTILAKEYSREEKMEAIKNYGKDINKDNFSAYLVCIANIIAEEVPKEIITEEIPKEIVTEEVPKEDGVFDKLKKWWNT